MTWFNSEPNSAKDSDTPQHHPTARPNPRRTLTRRARQSVCAFAALAVAAALLAVVPPAAGAQSGGLEVDLPANTDCRGAAVITKATVVEDAAAANMLAEALNVLSGGARRCLLDAGLPPSRSSPQQQPVPPSSIHRSSALLASKVYVVGGPTAIPDSWLAEQFGVTSFTRIAGADRWRTQENVAAAIVALATGSSVRDYDSGNSAPAGFLPNGSCHGTAVLAKLTVVEERAAANMLAEALRAISGTPQSRCLIDVGDPGVDVPVPPTAVAVAEAQQAAGVYLLGGKAAVPQTWLDNDFDIRFLERISGPDRWATQAAVAQRIIDIAQGGTLPHQYIDVNGDLISIHDDRLFNVSGAERGDIRALYRDLPSMGNVIISVHYCAPAGRLDGAVERKDATDAINDAVQLLNNAVPRFLEAQSSGRFTAKFTHGNLFGIAATEEVNEDDWESDLNSKNPASQACATRADEGIVMADQPYGDLRLGGYSSDRRQVMVHTLKHREPPDWVHSVTHEIGHSWLALCHPHDSEESVKEVDLICREGHDKHAFSKDLEADKFDRDKDNPWLCDLMSYCGAYVLGHTWIACGQRKILGWPDGPPTPYGYCRNGHHRVMPTLPISGVIAQWPSGSDRPYVTVRWDASKLPSCASGLQVTFEKHPTSLNFDDAMKWESRYHHNGVVLLHDRPRKELIYSRDKDATYEVKLKYRCGKNLESQWSAARTITTPAKPSGKPGTPGKPSVSSREARYLGVDWSEASGIVARHEVQWRPSKSTSAWQSRVQENDGRQSYIDGLLPGSCYEVRVRAGNDAGWGARSPTAEICTTGSAQLPTPSGLALVAESDSIRVVWSVPLVYHPDVLANVTGFTVEWGCETAHIAPLGGSEPVGGEARSFTIDGLAPGDSLPNGRSCKVRVAAVGPNSKAGTFTDWESVTVEPQTPTGSVSITAGPVNASRTGKGSCGSGNDCHDLRYTISGLGSGPYALECWFNGQRAWRGQWSGNASTGCYYSSAFSGTVQMAVDGVKSNTITVTGTQRRSEPDAPARPSLSGDGGSVLVSWSAPDDNGASIDRYEVRYRRSGRASWSNWDGNGSSRRLRIASTGAGVTYEVGVRARNSEGWGPWSPTATITTQQAQASVTISAGPVNSTRTSRGSCSGNSCHDLRYTINGLGSGRYTLECWFNGQRAWRGNWSGNSSTGCYYSSTFRGTIHVVIDGVKSNTITIR